MSSSGSSNYSRQYSEGTGLASPSLGEGSERLADFLQWEWLISTKKL